MAISTYQCSLKSGVNSLYHIFHDVPDEILVETVDFLTPLDVHGLAQLNHFFRDIVRKLLLNNREKIKFLEKLSQAEDDLNQKNAMLYQKAQIKYFRGLTAQPLEVVIKALYQEINSSILVPSLEDWRNVHQIEISPFTEKKLVRMQSIYFAKAFRLEKTKGEQVFKNAFKATIGFSKSLCCHLMTSFFLSIKINMHLGATMFELYSYLSETNIKLIETEAFDKYVESKIHLREEDTKYSLDLNTYWWFGEDSNEHSFWKGNGKIPYIINEIILRELNKIKVKCSLPLAVSFCLDYRSNPPEKFLEPLIKQIKLIKGVDVKVTKIPA